MTFRSATLLTALALAASLAGCQESPDYRFGGYVEAEKIEVGSRVGGRVLETQVDDGDAVKAGQPLVKFEAVHLQAQLTAAEHRVERLQTNLEKLRSGPRKQEIEIARSAVTAFGSQVENARSQFRRGQEAGANVMSAEQLQNLKTAVEVAEADYRSRVEQLALLEEGTRREDLVIAERELQEAQAEVVRLTDQFGESVVRAPVDAIVEVFDLEPGDLIAGGAPLATLVRADELWVRCFVPTTLLSFVNLGQAVQVSVDSRPQEEFQGEVLRISRVAEYTPRNVQTFEQRSDQVCAVKVRVQDPRDVLRPGMAAVVHVPKKGGERNASSAQLQAREQPRTPDAAEPAAAP